MQKVGSIEEDLKKYSFFEYNQVKRIIYGDFYISEKDSYNIEIHLSDFPNKFPVVFEMNERIPRKAHRHINGNSSLCFTTPTNEMMFLRSIIHSLDEFISYMLKPYLFNNSYYEENKKYKYGEYSHHPVIATYETYVDLIDVENIPQLINILSEAINKKKYRPNDLCYCGSGVKIKKCKDHENKYKKLHKIDFNTLSKDLLKIKQLQIEVLKLKYVK